MDGRWDFNMPPKVPLGALQIKVSSAAILLDA